MNYHYRESQSEHTFYVAGRIWICVLQSMLQSLSTQMTWQMRVHPQVITGYTNGMSSSGIICYSK